MPRCPNCVDSDPVVLYCPTCQNAVPPKVARHTSNKCPRNCLRCGACGANTLVVTRGEAYAVRCAVCEWVYEGLEKRSFAAQVMEARGKEPRKSLESAYLGESPHATTGTPAGTAGAETAKGAQGGARNAPRDEESTQDAENAEKSASSAEPTTSQLPQLVSLRSRWQRACRACRHVLVKPDSSPGSKYDLKSMAMAMLPRVEAYDSSLLFTNALSIPIKVSLQSTQVAFASAHIPLGSLSSAPENVHELRQVPEEFVQRQTDASRQVYMSGVRKQAEFGIVGPNWSSVRYEEVGNGGDPFNHALLAIRYEAQTAAHQIYVWIRWPRKN